MAKPSVMLGTIFALSIGLAGSAWWAGANSQSPDQRNVELSPPAASWITSPVELRPLVDSVVLRGNVQPSRITNVEVPVSVEGRAVLTRLPNESSEPITEGSLVAEISGRPVFLLQGTLPSYRTLIPGMRGPDIEQLQVALLNLGYRPESDGTFGPQTKKAIDAFYLDRGYSTVPTSTTLASDLLAAQQALDEADQALQAAESQLKQAKEGPTKLEMAQANLKRDQAQTALDDGQAASDAAIADANREYQDAIGTLERLQHASQPDEAELAAARNQVKDLENKLQRVKSTQQGSVTQLRDALSIAQIELDALKSTPNTDTQQSARDAAVVAQKRAKDNLDTFAAANGPTVPLGEVVFIDSAEARIASTSIAIGDQLQLAPGIQGDATSASESGITLATGEDLVIAQLTADDLEFATVGALATLLDESSGKTYRSELVSVAEISTIGTDGSRVHIAQFSLPNASQEFGINFDFRVTLEPDSDVASELIVPLSAITSADDQSTHVAVVRNSNDQSPRDVSVVVRQVLNGYAAVLPTEGSNLTAGDMVVVGR